MLKLFSNIDSSLFLFINGLPHNNIFDSIFAFFSMIGYYGIIWIVLGVIILIWEEIEDKKHLVALCLSTSLSYILVDLILKNVFLRPRPELILNNINVIWDMTNSFSFPSSHAAISFAAAYIMAKEHKRFALFYYLLAVVICFSRIYLGKHYPSDVFAGMILGLLVGYIALRITPGIMKYFVIIRYRKRK